MVKIKYKLSVAENLQPTGFEYKVSTKIENGVLEIIVETEDEDDTLIGDDEGCGEKQGDMLWSIFHHDFNVTKI